MRKSGLCALLILAGCGDGSGQVDPANEDACLLWANGVCRLAYLCVDSASRDAAFVALYGSSSDTCFQGLQKRCTSNQPAGNSFGPSCGPGKAVSQTSLQTCDNNLLSLSCADWQAAPAGGCEDICAPARMDAGGGGPSMALTDFCVAFGKLGCERHFACDPSGSASTYGDLSACKATLTSECTSNSDAVCPAGFDGSFAATCLAEYAAASCAIVSMGASQIPSCDNTCKYDPQP